MPAVVADIERRITAGHVRMSVDEGRRIKGHAIVFHALSEDLGGFRERIMPSAVDRTLRDGLDVRALVDHDTAKILGRVSAGTLGLRKDRTGLSIDVDPPNTTYANDLVVSIDRGDISGMSFGFRVLEDQWHVEDGDPVREVLDMLVYEVSAVTFPAYPDTSVALRSLRESPLHSHQRSTSWLRRKLRTTLAR